MAEPTFRVAFFASRQSHQMPKYGGQGARFDSVQFNDGYGYGEENGVFTAPVRGTYSFTVNTLKYEKDQKEFVRLKHNNVIVASMYSDSAGDAQNLSTTVLLKLERGDQVWVYLDTNGESESDCGMNGNGYSSFAGYLLYESY